MKLLGFVDHGDHQWPPPPPATLPSFEIEVEPETTFEVGARRLIEAAGYDPKDYFYWPYLLPHASSQEIVHFPSYVIADDGEFLWTEGARSRVTFADLARTREAGLTEGDPYVVYLERPSYGDGILPTWEEFFAWIEELARSGAVALFLGVVKKAYRRWKDRGASRPLAFLDLVVTREEWDIRDLCAWFGLSRRDGEDLLSSLGFEASNANDPDVWVVSQDPARAELRRMVSRDYLHRDGDA